MIDEKAAAEVTKEQLANREWRIDNLYTIRDETGQPIKFVRRPAQKAFDEAMWYRNVLPKARKLGFSTFIAMFILDESLFRSGTVAGIVDKTLNDAEEKLAMIEFAYEGLPETLKKHRPLVRQADKYLEWDNGSSVSVGLSYRGGTPRIIHVSEYGKISVTSPDQANEIKTGAIQAVPQTGFVFVESTAHGTGGEFYNMVQRAEKARIAGQPLTRVDFKSHFYGWMHKPEYRLPNNLVIVTQEMLEYFDELEAKHGIKLDGDQRAWYQKKFEELGPDDVKQEFPSVASELFYSSIQGAYFRREMTKARMDGRIGGLVPHDPTRRVNTFWDIGEDCTSIGFHQGDGVRHRFIDYFEEEGGSLQSAARVLDEKAKTRGFIYDKHYGPHDFDNRDWGDKAKSRKQQAKELGIEITVVERVGEKADSIEAARRMLGLSWFDAKHCSRLVECLDNYRKQWNEKLGVFRSEPVHDWACHAADMVQQGAMGLQPERVKKSRGEKPRGSVWSQ